MTDVSLKFGGEKFDSWSSIQIIEKMDSVATFGFESPFDFNNQNFRNRFKPFQYQDVDVAFDNESIFKGTAVSIMPNEGVNSSTISVNGYAKAGVLGDCQAPPDNYPLEFLDLNLQNIAMQLAGYFSLNAVFDNPPGAPFEEVALRTDQNIFDFLTSLAKERGLVISSNANGDPLFQKTKRDRIGDITNAAPVATPENFDGQRLFSQYTAMGSTVPGLGADKFSVPDDRISALRPFVFNTDGANDADVSTDAQNKASRSYSGAISWNVPIPSFTGPDGLKWKPNKIVEYENPKAFIYKKTDFLIRSVEFNKTPTSESVVLNLVMPESFEGKIPKVLPWE